MSLENCTQLKALLEKKEIQDHRGHLDHLDDQADLEMKEFLASLVIVV